MSKHKKSKSSKSLNRVYAFFMAIFISLLTIFVGYKINRYNIYEEQRLTLLKNIEEQEKLQEELTDKKEEQYSDEEIENIARTKLGMVKPNEILFIDQNK